MRTDKNSLCELRSRAHVLRKWCNWFHLVLCDFDIGKLLQWHFKCKPINTPNTFTRETYFCCTHITYYTHPLAHSLTYTLTQFTHYDDAFDISYIEHIILFFCNFPIYCLKPAYAKSIPTLNKINHKQNLCEKIQMRKCKTKSNVLWIYFWKWTQTIFKETIQA